jgi:hypothetical protein
MNESLKFSCFVLAIIVMLATSGCVAPPTESTTGIIKTNTNIPSDNPSGVSPTQTSGSAYVTEVIPGVTFYSAEPTVTETLGYHRFTTPTPASEEKSCRIYTTTQTFLYNGTAFTFDLKNPPMYINYTVIPTNITEKKYYTSRSKSKTETELEYSTYDPLSFLEITVRNKTDGEIYLQDGFGQDYTSYLTRTLKVIKQDDMLIEIKGNKIQATVNFWVKPEGNIDNPDNMTCTYWGESPRDITAYALAVTTTATPEYNPNVPTATRRPETMQTYTPHPTVSK